MRRYVAADLGASGGRVMVGSWDGARFALEERHRFPNGAVTVEGRRHWDVLRLWDELCTGLARVGAGSGEGGGSSAGGAAPTAIGVDTWGVDVALLDGAGRLLGNPYHYRDERTEGIPALVDALVPPAERYAATGTGTLQINTLFQLHAMVRAGDPALDAAAVVLPIPNLFTTWLGGERVAEYTHASTWECLDARARDWARPLLERVGIPARLLAPVVMPGTRLGELRADVAAEAGLRGRPAVIAIGCHDTASAVAAIPDLDPGSVYLSSGTWSLMGVELPEPIISEEARALGFTNEGGVGGTIRFLRVLAGLWLVQESRRIWARDGEPLDWEELFARAEAAPPFGSIVDPDAPELLAPDDMPAAIRAACRASGQAVPEDAGALVRTCLESLAVRARATLDELETLTERRLDTIRIVGGGSRNRILCRMIADATGRPVVTGPAEATAFGNVMVQAIATGDLAGIAEGRAAIGASVERERFEPRPDDRWAEALARLRAIEAARRG